MPYIPRDQKERLLRGLSVLSPGDLNYMFTRLMKDYVKENGLRYQTLNEIMGAIEGAKIEFYSRVVRPYEDKKIEENGDVYG